jgi:NitT/TauT family transport system permease protein
VTTPHTVVARLHRTVAARLRRGVAAAFPPLAGAGAVAAGWWAATTLLGVPAYLLPTPARVAAAYAHQPGYLARNTWTTLAETVQGFTLAAVCGLALGILLASSRALAQAFYPTLIALHAIPKLALAPLLVVWLGFGTTPKVVMVVLVCAFPILLATTTGLTRTPVELVEYTRSLCASWWQTMLKLRLPAALPQIFTGLKTAMPLAVIGAVIGELFGATAGLGYTIQTAGSDTAVVYAALLLLAALSITLFYLLAAAERLLAPWTRHTTT